VKALARIARTMPEIQALMRRVCDLGMIASVCRGACNYKYSCSVPQLQVQSLIKFSSSLRVSQSQVEWIFD
jgi:hypothetical protein